MPFERLHRTKPDVAHLRVFGCGAYVFLPKDVQSNNLSPISEMMTFIGIVEGTKGYIFMRSPNNVVFTAIQALFDETLFPKCPSMRRLGYTPVGLPSDDLQGEHNRPPDNENEDHGGGLPPLPYGPAGQVPWQHMQPRPYSIHHSLHHSITPLCRLHLVVDHRLKEKVELYPLGVMLLCLMMMTCTCQGP
jgi:hypothetical protein